MLAYHAHPAAATTYEVLYDANADGVFPEDVGWQRFTTQGGAARTVENGLFTLMAQNPNPNGGSDQYLWDAMETLNAGPGEMFYAEWRMRIMPGSDGSDVNVFIATDGQQRAFNLLYSTNGMRSSRDGREVFMDMTEFHTFRFESVDMIDYAMFIDAQLAWEGFFASPTSFSSWVIFGDGFVGAASASQWDYFRFGVSTIPEPASMGIFLLSGVVIRRKTFGFAPLAAMVAIAAFAPPVEATQYEVHYDANTDGVFPEDEGWLRITSGGGVDRNVSGGIFTLTARNPSPSGGSDQYRWNAGETLDPDPGEMFYAEWRMRVMPGSDGSDVHVLIVPDGMLRDFDLLYGTNGARSTGDGRQVFMDMTVLRTFRLESTDMVDYSFYIDGHLAWEGFFALGTTLSSVVRFGDGLVGSASGSQWDYVRFGVAPIPEPPTSLLMITGCLALLRRGRKGIWLARYSLRLNQRPEGAPDGSHGWSEFAAGERRATRGIPNRTSRPGRGGGIYRTPLAGAIAALTLLASLFLAPPAFATPYKIEYDANTDGVFPEDVGWQRFTSQGGAARTVENGIFTLMAQNPNPNGGSDQYLWDAMETLDPDPGEMFYAEWRMRVLPGSDSSDVNIFIATDGMQRDFNLLYATNTVRSSRDGRQVFMDMTVFHTFRLESPDMIDYTMSIDGQLAWEGFFASPTGFSSWFVFGDGLFASASGSQWDFVRFGVSTIPEPPSVVVIALGGITFVARRRFRQLVSMKEDRPCLDLLEFW